MKSLIDMLQNRYCLRGHGAALTVAMWVVYPELVSVQAWCCLGLSR